MGRINQRPKIDLRKVFLEQRTRDSLGHSHMFRKNRIGSMFLRFACISHSLFSKGKGKIPVIIYW